MISKLSMLKRHVDAIGTGLRYLFTKNRITLMYPEATQVLPIGYRGFIKFHRDRCISCTLCARICPADAIKMHTLEQRRYPGISYLRCIFCAFCIDICPTEALESTDIHDGAYYTREEQTLDPIKFGQDPSTPPYRKKSQKVKARIDSRRGLRYDRD